MENQKLVIDLIQAARILILDASPNDYSTIVDNHHLGMFTVHGHKLDALDHALDDLGEALDHEKELEVHEPDESESETFD